MSVNGLIVESNKTAKFEDYYELSKSLGRKPLQSQGSGSYVAVCIERGTNTCYASKVMQKKMTSAEKKNSIGHLLKVDHKNLVRLKEVFETPLSLYLITELAYGGELFQRLTKFPVYNEKIIVNYFRQIVNGIRYLHEYGIIHRNLKPENILLSSRENDAIVKITDYSPQLFTTEDLDIELVCFMTTFCAPELLLSRRYDKTIDLWALGILLYIMLSGNDPYQSKTGSDLYCAILHCDVDYKSDPWQMIGLNAQDAVKKLLVVDPQLRIITPHLLNHSWLSGIDEHEQHLDSVQKNLELFNKQRSETLNCLNTEQGQADWITCEYSKLPRRSTISIEMKEESVDIKADKAHESGELTEDGERNDKPLEVDNSNINVEEQNELKDIDSNQIIGNSFKNLLNEYSALNDGNSLSEGQEEVDDEDINQSEVSENVLDAGEPLDMNDFSVDVNEQEDNQVDSEDNDRDELLDENMTKNEDDMEDTLELENVEA